MVLEHYRILKRINENEFESFRVIAHKTSFKTLDEAEATRIYMQPAVKKSLIVAKVTIEII